MAHLTRATLVLTLVLTATAQAQPLEGEAVVDLTRMINPSIIGGGVNFAFSDYTYIDFPSGGEWGKIHSQLCERPLILE